MADYRKVVGTFISYNENVQAQKKDGGTYQAWRLIFTKDSGEAETYTKPVQSLKFNRALASALKGLQAGEKFVIHEEKNAGGFWEVKNITKGEDTSEPMALAAPQQAKTYSGNTQSTGRDFETKEERNKKQEFIIRQSSLERAIETLSIGAKAALNPGQVIELAEVYSKYVLSGKAKVDDGSIEMMEDDIPQ